MLFAFFQGLINVLAYPSSNKSFAFSCWTNLSLYSLVSKQRTSRNILFVLFHLYLILLIVKAFPLLPSSLQGLCRGEDNNQMQDLGGLLED